VGPRTLLGPALELEHLGSFSDIPETQGIYHEVSRPAMLESTEAAGNPKRRHMEHMEAL
jgi:hypothetical protein